jgi:hypothetical protein
MKLNPYIYIYMKKVTKKLFLITDHFHYCLVFFSKVFEKIIYKGLHYHSTSNNILVKEQFDFRCNTSTETAIYTLLNNVLSSLNDKKIVGGLFCGFDDTSFNIANQEETKLKFCTNETYFMQFANKTDQEISIYSP